MGQGPKTRGERVYLIREALGTRRDPLSLEQFADLIRETSGVVYDTSMLSRMETGKRKVSIEDIEAIAPVDPLKRGRAWLAGWEDQGGQQAGPAEPSKPTAPIQPPPLDMFRRIESGDDLRDALGEEKPAKKKRGANGKDAR